MSVLAQFLMLGQNSVGTQALSQDQTSFFTQAVNTFADIICETFTKYAIARLLELNGFDPDGISLTHTPAGDTNLGALADFLQKTGDKLTWMPQDEVWLRGVADLPEVDEETIQDERDRKAAQAVALFQRKQPGPGEPPQDEDEEPPDKEQMSTDFFAARRGRPKDESERLAWEGRYERLQRRFFADQYSRVLNSAKGLRNDA